MDSTDNPIVWHQMSQSLLQMREKYAIDDQLVKTSCEAKVKQLNQLVKDIKKRIREKEKKESELCLMDKAIAKANANIEKAEAKTAKVQECRLFAAFVLNFNSFHFIIFCRY